MNNITSFLHKIINQIIRKKKNNPFYDYPFGRKPHATKEEYLTIWDNSKKENYLVVDNVESETGFAINSDWYHVGDINGLKAAFITST